MSFPLDHRGEVSWTIHSGRNADWECTTLLNAVVEQLQKESANDISVIGNRIRFKGGVFRFVHNWNLLISISSGSVEAVPVNGRLIVTYYLNFKQLLIFSTVLASLMGLVIVGENGLPVEGKLAIVGFTWLWLFGMNFLIAILRFPGLIDRAMKTRAWPQDERI